MTNEKARVSTLTPTRVLISSDSDSTTPLRAKALGIVPEVIFVRDDGWSLGAPLKLRERARLLWSGSWTEEWRLEADGTWYRRWVGAGG